MDLNSSFYKYVVYYPVVWARGQAIPSYIRRLRRTQYLEKDKLIELQLLKVNSLLRHANRTVPFYAKSLGLTGGVITTIKDLEKLPCLTKNEIQLMHKDFMSSVRFYLVTKKTTGGSTGQPLTIYKSRRAMAWELAALWRGYSWAGIDIGDKQARFWGVPFSDRDKLRAKVIDAIGNRKRCSAFSFDRTDMERYTDKLISFRPSYFHGYVSMMEEYAKFFEMKGEKAPFNLRCVITTSEVLTDYHRRLFERVFSTRSL